MPPKKKTKPTLAASQELAALPPSPAKIRTIQELALVGGTRHEFLENFNTDLADYDDQSFSPEEVAKISRYMQKVSTGSASVLPMICYGPTCPFANTCPLQQMDKAPIGKPCLIEAQLQKEWTARYITEYNVEPTSYTELGYCMELAELDILLTRINQSLGKAANAELVTDQMVGVARDGSPIVQKQISPLIETKMELQNRRSKIIKLMVGDRQERYKKEAALKQKTEVDPSNKMAQMRKQLEALSRGLDNSALSAPNQEKVLTAQDLINQVE